MDTDSFLNPEPQVEVYGARPLDSWGLGALCRYDSSYGSEDYGFAARLTIRLTWYEIVKKTPKGCWIALGWYGGPKKFVLGDARKRFAYPTEELARESFIARKQRRISRLKFDLEHAEAALKYMGDQCNFGPTKS